jgi:hypothetical protein
MDKAHCSRYSIHPGTNKLYQDLKKNFWWTRMKREIAKYVSECDTYQRVKADHLRPTGNLQPLSIPERKWEDICMDFIVGLPHTMRGYNSIWVIVDCLTKSAHFIPISMTYRVRQYAKLYISPTEGLSLSLAFGSNYRSVWAPILSEAQLITPRLVDRLSESIKSSKICFVLVF